MICPRCSVAEIVPATGACSLCGYEPDGAVAVEAPHPDATDQMARQELAHEFRIDVLLGQGVHSAVYLAREGRSSKYMVLKVLPRPSDRDPLADERFRRAAELLASLDHPHIVPVHRFGTTDSLFWYTMDHVRARSLREILRSRGPMELKMCQRIVAQIASALDYAHRRGVVHGAIKPENVLVDPNGWVHVCDAMVTRAIEQAAPQLPRRSSSAQPAPPEAEAESDANAAVEVPAATRRRPDYVAPEDWAGLQRSATSDQYALGVLVYECLAGAPPSAGAESYEPPARLESVRPDLPPHVTHAVRRALSQKPSDRYPSVLDFVMALESGVLPLTDARPSGRASDLILTVPDWEPPPSDRPRYLVPLIVLVVMAVAGALLWNPLMDWRQRRDWDQRMADRVIPATVRPETTTVADSAAGAAPSRGASAVTRGQETGSSSRRSRTTTSRSEPSSNPPARTEAPATASPSPSPAPAASAPATPAIPSPGGEPGRLFVNASPWGQVFVDGTAVGNTPKANLAVAPGSHTIRVVRDGFEPWERTVQVGAGEVVRLTGIVLTARP